MKITVELYIWPLPQQSSFGNFLCKLKSTLKELRIVDCAIFEDPSLLGRWAGANMLLSGVEVNVLPESKDAKDMDDWHRWDVDDLEALWLADRPNSLLS